MPNKIVREYIIDPLIDGITYTALLPSSGTNIKEISKQSVRKRNVLMQTVKY